MFLVWVKRYIRWVMLIFASVSLLAFFLPMYAGGKIGFHYLFNPSAFAPVGRYYFLLFMAVCMLGIILVASLKKMFKRYLTVSIFSGTSVLLCSFLLSKNIGTPSAFFYVFLAAQVVMLIFGVFSHYIKQIVLPPKNGVDKSR